MKIIKNSKELKKLVDKNKDLHLKGEDVHIEFEPTRWELRDVYCWDLTMGDGKEYFDFNGGDFNGRNFNGGDFNGRNFNGGDFNGGDFNGYNFNGWDFNGGDFNGGDFNGGDFNGWDFNGWDFRGKKVFYHAFFNCYGEIHCQGKPKARRKTHAEPVSLAGVYDYNYKPEKPEEPKYAYDKEGNKIGEIVDGRIIK